MITINLLPSQRARQLRVRRIFRLEMAMGGGILLMTILAFWLIGRALDQEIANREHDVQVKTGELAALTAKAMQVKEWENKREVLQRHARILDELKKGQSNPVRVLDTVSQSLDPLKLWLTRLTMTGDRIQIEGRALTNIEIVQFVRNLHRTGRFGKIWLEESRAGQEGQFAIFQFQLRMVWLGVEAA